MTYHVYFWEKKNALNLLMILYHSQKEMYK
jgi:hypothetical protein